MAITDSMRAQALASALKKAKEACGISGRATISDIIMLGPRCGIEPRLYDLAWFLHRTGINLIF